MCKNKDIIIYMTCMKTFLNIYIKLYMYPILEKHLSKSINWYHINGYYKINIILGKFPA